MDAAASVVGAVSFALASTKTIYNTISGIRHARDNTQRTAQSLKEMEELLEQVNGLDACKDSDLISVIQDYEQLMEDFRKEIDKVQCLPTDSRVLRF